MNRPQRIPIPGDSTNFGWAVSVSTDNMGKSRFASDVSQKDKSVPTLHLLPIPGFVQPALKKYATLFSKILKSFKFSAGSQSSVLWEIG
jgi:hypothetical protein